MLYETTTAGTAMGSSCGFAGDEHDFVREAIFHDVGSEWGATLECKPDLGQLVWGLAQHPFRYLIGQAEEHMEAQIRKATFSLEEHSIASEEA